MLRYRVYVSSSSRQTPSSASPAHVGSLEQSPQSVGRRAKSYVLAEQEVCASAREIVDEKAAQAEVETVRREAGTSYMYVHVWVARQDRTGHARCTIYTHTYIGYLSLSGAVLSRAMQSTRSPR